MSWRYEAHCNDYINEEDIYDFLYPHHDRQRRDRAGYNHEASNIRTTQTSTCRQTLHETSGTLATQMQHEEANRERPVSDFKVPTPNNARQRNVDKHRAQDDIVMDGSATLPFVKIQLPNDGNRMLQHYPSNGCSNHTCDRIDCEAKEANMDAVLANEAGECTDVNINTLSETSDVRVATILPGAVRAMSDQYCECDDWQTVLLDGDMPIASEEAWTMLEPYETFSSDGMIY